MSMNIGGVGGGNSAQGAGAIQRDSNAVTQSVQQNGINSQDAGDKIDKLTKDTGADVSPDASNRDKLKANVDKLSEGKDSKGADAAQQPQGSQDTPPQAAQGGDKPQGGGGSQGSGGAGGGGMDIVAMLKKLLEELEKGGGQGGGAQGAQQGSDAQGSDDGGGDTAGGDTGGGGTGGVNYANNGGDSSQPDDGASQPTGTVTGVDSGQQMQTQQPQPAAA